MVITTPDGNEVGRTPFEYFDEEEVALREFVQREDLQYSFFTEMAEQWKQDSGENITENSNTFGEVKHFGGSSLATVNICVIQDCPRQSGKTFF